MRKIVLAIVVVAIVLLFSGCATIMAMLDMRSTDNYNKELARLSVEDKVIVEKIGLAEIDPAINPGLAVLVDAWALSPILLFAAYADKSEFPGWASLLSLTGILGGAPASLLCSGISFFSSLKTSPSVDIEQYKTKTAQQERELEAKQKFMEDSTQCPLLIERVEVIKEPYNYRIRLTIKNISPWKVTAFKVSISGWSVFGDRLRLAVASDDLVGISQNIDFPPLTSRESVWESYVVGLNKAQAEIIQVMYADGTQWPK